MSSSAGVRHDLAATLRAAGMRVTSTRERVYGVVAAAPHSTPDTIIELVNAGGPHVPPSSVYRALDALEEVGVVTHTHLDHHAPTYHLADHARHLHLVCRSCGAVAESPAAVADALVADLEQAHGFLADVTHMAIQGECRQCRT
ncbi:MAG: Fur family transcriptional regulator [Actinomycetia bacterium]|nr:Fur family transcriptional regulator [Actinomycetes bacterium]